MATATLDVIEGSQAEYFGNVAERAVRMGIVEGLPTTGNPEDVLWAAMNATGMPATGTPYPGRSNCYLRSIQVFGQSHEIARVRLLYEPFEGTGTTLLIRIGASLTSYQTNKIPGTWLPLNVDYEPPDGTGEYIPMSMVTFNILRPLRRVSVMQMRAGTLDVTEAQEFSENVGKVNDAEWMGKESGAWLISNADATISKYNGYYQRTIEAMSQGSDIWRYGGILRSQTTGRYAWDDDISNRLQELRSYPYEFGSSFLNGCISLDPYETIPFTPLFGF